jgi:hypothetical protein
MNKNTYISKFLGLILLVSVLCAHLAGANTPVPLSKKTKAPTEKTSKNAELNTVSSEIVVPTFHFEFGDLGFPNFNNIFLAFVSEKTIITQFAVIFSNTYFEKTFEHHIAINAP